MEKKNKKSIILVMTILILITITLLGLTYAYYRTRVIGNQNNKSISITTEKLEIVYDDGTGIIIAEGIVPGYTATKTFSVENTGDTEVNYAVYLEEVTNTYLRTSDWEFEVTCSPDCSGTDGVIEYPQLNEQLIENKIPSKGTQTYTMTLKYKNIEDTNQSEDMGATLSGKFQIYSLEDTIDIEGYIATAEEGDYVEINSIPKTSRIVDGKYRLPAVEVGSHTLKVVNKNGKIKGSTNLIIAKGETSGIINESTIYVDDTTTTTKIDITNISENLGIEIQNVIDFPEKQYSYENAPVGTLLYAIKNDNEITENVIDIGDISNEAILSYTEDDYGTSYYFRGAVENNFVNFANMCWRIVRVQGNGNIKLVLADGENECNESGYSKDNSTSGIIGHYNYFAYSYAKTIIKVWANGGSYGPYNKYSYNEHISSSDLEKIAETEWCEDYSIYDETIEIVGDKSAYEVYIDLYSGIKRYEDNTPTLKCNMIGEISGNAKKTNAKLGMLTLDEIMYAGYNFLNTNAEYYTYTLTPYSSTSDGYDYNFISKNNSIESEEYYSSIKIRPSIVLKSMVKVKEKLDTKTYGVHGTQTNPYVIY